MRHLACLVLAATSCLAARSADAQQPLGLVCLQNQSRFTVTLEVSYLNAQAGVQQRVRQESAPRYNFCVSAEAARQLTVQVTMATSGITRLNPGDTNPVICRIFRDVPPRQITVRVQGELANPTCMIEA